jgi:enoyl-CoA hydratase/carnithine racemase
METPVTLYADGALRLSVQDGVATLTLDRPKSKNAINQAMWRALPGIVAEAAADPAVRVLVVRGASATFASGADIAEFPIVFADKASALKYGLLIETAATALSTLNKPTIALIEGFCIGAGLAIALACDLRICSADARMGAPPAKLGLMYSLGDTRRLVDAVGASTAKDMLFTGALIPSGEALRIGLVNAVHAGEALEAAIMAKANAIAGLSSWSMAHNKMVVEKILKGQSEDTDDTRDWFASAVDGPDFQEALLAFHAKRPPVFP